MPKKPKQPKQANEPKPSDKVDDAQAQAQGRATPSHTMWSGTISFGLVSVPVALLPAVRSDRVPLRMLDKDGTPLRRRYFCPKENREVHDEHIIRGYAVSEDHYVTVTDDELQALEPRKSRDIDLRLFVDRTQIDPVYFDRPYFLVPATESTKAYRLLAQTMQRTHRAGIATFVMRDREYLIAILAQDGVLRGQTMRFEDEIRSPQDVGLPERKQADRKLTAKFTQAVKQQSGPFEPAVLATEDEKQLLELVRDKFERGRDVVESEVAADESSEASVQSLMDALEQSMQAGRAQRKKSA